jgi:hypothetical protein
MPRSHRHGLMVSITPKRGLHVYFQKRASGYNQCVGAGVRSAGVRGKGIGRQAVRSAFKQAVQKCAPQFR